MAVPSNDPPPRHLPKLFQPSQMAVISLHAVRDDIHSRNISLPSRLSLMMLWWHPLYRTAISPSSAGAPEQAAAVPAPTSPNSSGVILAATALSWKFLPASWALSSNWCRDAVHHDHPTSHMLEHGYHIQLCILTGKEERGRCHQAS